VANQFISIEKARDQYKVVIDPKTLEVDTKETARLRAKEKTA
jgi:hypothetical protein